MNGLFSPYALKDMVMKNRIVMAPMCMYMAEAGMADDWHLAHYASRAAGGAGLIVFEATAVSPEGRISDYDLGLWRDEQVPGLRRIVDAIHREGAMAGIQLGHAGRKSEVSDSEPVSCSALRFNEEGALPMELDYPGIHRIIGDFGHAAARAHAAGFDYVELHGAHGYLINQFLSPLVNQRTDGYGGQFENRARFLLETIREVRLHWPKEKPLAVRISAEEYDGAGNHTVDMAAILNLVKSEGLDIVHVSSGGVVPGVVETWPGYQIRFAENIRLETELPVIGGGLITSPQQAEDIVRSGRADLVFLGRELLRNPFWPLLSARSIKADAAWPEPYERAKPF